MTAEGRGRRLLGRAALLVPLVLAGAACAGESSACASDGIAEFCLGPGGEIRGSGFEPGTEIAASADGGETTEAEVTDDGWFPGTVAYPEVEDEIVVTGTREDGEPVRIVLEDPSL